MLLLVTEPKPSHMNALPPALGASTLPTFFYFFLFKTAVISFPLLLLTIAAVKPSVFLSC